MSLLNIYLLHESKEFLDYFRLKSISVGKKYSAASIISSFKEWVSYFSKEQLQEKVPNDITNLINRIDQLDIKHIKMTLNYFKDIFIDGSHFKNDES